MQKSVHDTSSGTHELCVSPDLVYLVQKIGKLTANKPDTTETQLISHSLTWKVTFQVLTPDCFSYTVLTGWAPDSRSCWDGAFIFSLLVHCHMLSEDF